VEGVFVGFGGTIFKTVWKDGSTKANKDALHLSAEYLRLLTLEAIHRSYEIAEKEGSTTLDAEHLEKIVAQLMLDF